MVIFPSVMLVYQRVSSMFNSSHHYKLHNTPTGLKTAHDFDDDDDEDYY